MKNWDNQNNKFAKAACIALILVFLLGLFGGCAINNTNGSSDLDDKACFEQINEVCDSISTLKRSKEFQNNSIAAQTDLVLKELKTLAKAKKIKADSIICDEKEHIITFEYGSGILGCDIVGGFKEGCEILEVLPDCFNMIRNIHTAVKDRKQMQ